MKDYEHSYDGDLDTEFFDEDEGAGGDNEPLDDEMFMSMNDDEMFPEDMLLDESEDFDGEDEERAPVEMDELSDTVGLYLKEMARVPLLSTEEEVGLALRIEAGLNAAKKL